MKFDDMIQTKYSQLNEQPQQPGVVTNVPVGTQPTQQAQPVQQAQPTQQAQTQAPEQILTNILTKIPFNNPETALKMFNTAAISLKANPHFQKFFSNVGFQNGQFVYNPSVVQQPKATNVQQATSPEKSAVASPSV